MDLITVIVATFNSSKTVIDTLESIHNQTYARLELIVSDDCSTDNTIETVRGWMQINCGRFAKARILKARKNHGVTKNCNIAINQANGKYIQIMAGDDILMEDALMKKKQFAEKNNLNVVFTKVEVFGNNIRRINWVRKYFEKGYDIIPKGWQEQYNQIIEENFTAGPEVSFFLTEYIQKMGGFDIRYPMLEDYPFVFHYILAGNEIVLLEEELVKYRVSNSSIASNGSKEYLKSLFKFLLLERLRELIKNREYKIAIGQVKRYASMLARSE